MKRIFLAATMSAALVTAQAHAGGMAEPMMEPEVIVEEAASSSGGFVVPLILLALVALALANNNDDSIGGDSEAASDLRLKTDVVQVGMSDIGLPLYHFRYLDTGPVFEGVMAQDVLQHVPEAIIPMPGGYMAVDYGMLGLALKRLD